MTQPHAARPLRLFVALALFLCLGVSAPASAYWGGGFALTAGGHIVPSGLTATIECSAIKDAANLDLTNTNWTGCALTSFPPGSNYYGLYYMTISGTAKAAPYSPASATYLPGIGCPTGQTRVYDYSQITGCTPINTSSSGELRGNPCPTCDGAVPGQPDGAPASNSSGMSIASPGIQSVGASSRGSAGTGGRFESRGVESQSGNVFYSVTDYESAGLNKLSFARFYNSREGRESYAKSFGQGWRHSYDRFITTYSSNSAAGYIERADGKRIPFSLSSGVIGAGNYYDYKGTYVDAGTARTFTLITPGDTVEVYAGTTAGGSIAQLQSITYRNGYTQTLSRSGTTITVTDSYARSLTLNCDSDGLLLSLNTPEGTTISYGYESDYFIADVSPFLLTKRLKQVTYPDAPSNPVSYAYYGTISYLLGIAQYVVDGSGNPISGFLLTSVTDQSGNKSNVWAYDQFGRGTASSGYNGSDLTAIAYNDSTGTRAVTLPSGEVDTYNYATLLAYPGISSIVRAATATTPTATENFSFDGYGQTGYRDWNSNLLTNTHDVRNLPTLIKEAVDGYNIPLRSTTFTYTTATAPAPYPTGYKFHTPATMNEGIPYGGNAARTTAYTYDTHGNMLTKTLHDASGQAQPDRVWTYTYDATGNVLTAQDPMLNTTTFSYTNGVLASVTDALGHSTTFSSFTGGGRPQSITDANGTTYTIAYDARQRVTSTSINVGGTAQTTTYSYRNNGEPLTTTYPDATLTTRDYAYEIAGNPLLLVQADGTGNKTLTTVNIDGKPVSTKTQDLANTTFLWRNATYDGIGRVKTQTNFDGTKANTYTYDKNGNVLTVADGNNHTTTYTYDVLNRRKTVVDANSGTTTINYNSLDQITTVSAPGTVLTTFTPDAFGDTMKEISPDRGTTNYTYDKNGNLTGKTDGASVVTNFTYDALNRPATIAYPASSGENVTFTYDQSGHGKGVGKLTSVTDAAGSLSLSYDERGLITARNRTSGASTMNTAYSYNSAGRLASITYPSGAVVSYTRDASGNIASVTYTPFGGSPTTVATYAGYLPFGPAKSIALGNGVTTSYAYDHDVNLTTLTDNSSLQNLTYTYDNANNVSSITDAIAAANTQTFGYDVLDRLTAATSGSGGYGTLAYAYNANGNRTSATVNGTATTYTTTAATNRLTAVGSQAISYNGNGNITTMITGGTTNYAFTYNNANRLATTTTPTSSTTNIYDAFGARFKKVTGANTTLYVTGAGNQMQEEDTNGTKTDYVYANGMAIASFSAGNLSYIHSDRMGVPQKATNGSKAVTWATTYEPYGKTAAITGTLTQNVRLPGQMFDSESGVYQNGQRDYLSWLGRYIESDPIGLSGGSNSYRYGKNNPIKFVDPSGLESCIAGGYCEHAPRGEEKCIGSYCNIDGTMPMEYPSVTEVVILIATAPFGGPGAKLLDEALEAKQICNIPNAAASDAMAEMKVCDGLDCSEIAERLLEAAGGEGEIIEMLPASGETLNLFEYGSVQGGFGYHQVYSDGRFIFDPRYSPYPAAFRDWYSHMVKLNPTATFR